MASKPEPVKVPDEEVPAETPDAPEVPTVETIDSRILTMATDVLSGDCFRRVNDEGETDLAAIIADRVTFGKFLDAMKGVGKAYDEQLVNLRRANGDDFLPGVDYFRKPREDKKATNSLLDSLKL